MRLVILIVHAPAASKVLIWLKIICATKSVDSHVNNVPTVIARSVRTATSDISSMLILENAILTSLATIIVVKIVLAVHKATPFQTLIRAYNVKFLLFKTALAVHQPI